MQTVLGAGGAAGTEVAKALRKFTGEVRLVSRNPRAVHPDDVLFPADLTEPEEVSAAVQGSEVAYLTVGLPYSTKVWRAQWPKIIENVLSACGKHGTRLVFLDNVYMYDPDHLGHMTEETPIRPVSKKGEVRRAVAERVLEAAASGRVQALIARSADFYGPSIRGTSVLTEGVFKNFSKGKKAFWFVSAENKHSFTYTPDMGRAMALLGNTPEAFNQVWHLPTAGNPWTGREWIEAIAREMGVGPEYRILSKTVLKILGIFVPVMKEMVEMLYQYERDYVFDSSKFESHFDFKPTPPEQGIREIVRKDYRKE